MINGILVRDSVFFPSAIQRFSQLLVHITGRSYSSFVMLFFRPNITRLSRNDI